MLSRNCLRCSSTESQVEHLALIPEFRYISLIFALIERVAYFHTYKNDHPMITDLKNLSTVLKLAIKTDNLFQIPYVQVNEQFVITEHFVTKELEINDLSTYSWEPLNEGNLKEILLNNFPQN